MSGLGGRTAVVLFNLGGPDSLSAVGPFLYNLFRDPAILGLPQPWRGLLARFIAWRRGPAARAIYARIGGRSPILAGTEAQARALEAELGGPESCKVFVAMRYSAPFVADAARAVAAYAPDSIALLPLYPQFSTTTTASSMAAWRQAAGWAGITAPSYGVCCYPTDQPWISAQAALIGRALEQAGAAGPARILFSAHGLPLKVVARGDPYLWQVERTAQAIGEVLAAGRGAPVDSVVCYQSRVGPLDWIGPSTEDEIRRAGADGVPVVIAPIAFVSEHSETLVELDIEGRALAASAGVPAYIRVPAVAADAAFINGLGSLVRELARHEPGRLCPATGTRLCPATFSQCAAGQPIGPRAGGPS